MSRYRILIVVAASLSATLWVYACGDGTTEPPPPDPPRPTTVTVTPDSVVFTAIGQTEQLAAEVRDQIGRPMVDVAVSWSSSDTTVAAVDSAGLVTAAGIGVTTVTATVGEVSGTALATVEQLAGSVIVSPAATAMAPGDTLRLVAEAFDENGHAVVSVEFAWASSDVSVATVDGSGLVQGVAKGTATITATAEGARGTAEIRIENPDRAALVALYEATGGASHWRNNRNWLTDAPLRQWYGVGTNASGRVMWLSLSGNQLTGPIPPELGNLSSLESLRLDNNRLIGEIPQELGNLSGLESLVLIHNALYGEIPPKLGTLANLEDLAVRDNDLTGPIPPELGNLSSLKRLGLDRNRLTGEIPPELGNLANLEFLHLAFNNLYGEIPSVLGGLSQLLALHVVSNDLAGPIPPELGNLATLRSLDVSDNDLTGRIPPELGNLATLRSLDIGRNELTGPIPPELGNLATLEYLSFSYNDLAGPIPLSFLRLDGLERFFARDNNVCFPGLSAFSTWLKGRKAHSVSGLSSCNAADIAGLKALHDATGGSSWARSDGWLTDQDLEEWYGVTADSLGRVTALELAGNGMSGHLPANLADLAEMTVLRLGGNALSGRLPLSLARLSLVELDYADTGLCAPADASFQSWLNGIASQRGSGAQCASISEREILAALYDATTGPNWTTNDKWLTDSPLGSWYGVSTDGAGRVVSLNLGANNLQGSVPPELADLANLVVLELFGNNLSGPVPPELGKLANLQALRLEENGLTGKIPPELGNLVKVDHLSLSGNRLTGPIPPELGNLGKIELLSLGGNRLTGSIPPELGNLGKIELLSLGGNRLTGSIPPELGKLRSVRYLALDGNALSGPIPPRLGALSTLERLALGNNDLTGSVPSDFGGMSELRELSVTNNEGLSGPLPAGLRDLTRLEVLLAGGTELCAPSDHGFQAWLNNIHKRRIKPCAEREAPRAYLIQSVQSRDIPVPLIAGERALLRVFVTAAHYTTAGIPSVHARFYRNGRETHVVDIPGKSDPIPTAVVENHLSQSANAEIPGEVILPGLEVVIEIDPDGTLDPGLRVAERIPQTGRLAIEVRTMPLFDLTLIPFVWTELPNRSIVDLVREMAADAEHHELLGDTRTLLPVGSLEVTAHEPVLSSSNNAHTLLGQTAAIRTMEAGTGHYMGMMPQPIAGPRGVAYIAGRLSFATPDGFTVAHELGHNMNLDHAPCGEAPGPDPSFPSSDGSIGTWGFDFGDGGRLFPPSSPDVMSYCRSRHWISDYHFTNALRYRLFDEGEPTDADAASTRSLLVWGGVVADTIPYLEPAFVVEAPAALPDSAGEYRVVGRTADGDNLFSISFTMPESADGDGNSSFAFVLPVQPGWESDLASITLSGRGGSATLDETTDRPMAIVRDPRSGKILAFLRDPLAAAPAGVRDVAGRSGAPGLRILLSRGLPDVAAWRR